ncbi:unnamed protein product [Phytophthora fragariaefolia]|uniref:Unnamed protein product n=1 Tax=Phytophthora fragariaefolia TaxID=1490495 RepID=A0A9W6Y5U4_9STRA|nr:unnamed protein product [Phytophthora fragariaefolia]
MTMTTRSTGAAHSASTPTNSATPRSNGTPVRKKRRTSGTRLSLGNNGNGEGDDTVVVSSGVRIAAAGAGGSEDGRSDDDEDNNRPHRSQDSSSGRDRGQHREEPPARAAPSNQLEPDADTQQDDLGSTSWWDLLTPHSNAAWHSD